MPAWIRAVTFFPIALRFPLTALQIYAKRMTESNPKFRELIIKLAQNHNIRKIKRDLKIKGIERSEDQINALAKIENEKAVILGAEVFSSAIGTGISVLVAAAGYYIFSDPEAEKRKEAEKLEFELQFKEMRADLTQLKQELAAINNQLNEPKPEINQSKAADNQLELKQSITEIVKSVMENDVYIEEIIEKQKSLEKENQGLAAAINKVAKNQVTLVEKFSK